jgi:hypothetical protein
VARPARSWAHRTRIFFMSAVTTRKVERPRSFVVCRRDPEGISSTCICLLIAAFSHRDDMTDNSGRGVSQTAPLCNSLLSFFQEQPPAPREHRGGQQSDRAKQLQRRRQLPVDAHRKGAPGTVPSHNIVEKPSCKAKEDRLAMSKFKNGAGSSQVQERDSSDRRRARPTPFESSLLMSTDRIDSGKGAALPQKKYHGENAPNSSRSRSCDDQERSDDPRKVGHGADVPRARSRTHRNALSALEILPSERSNDDERKLMAPPPPRISTANPEQVVPGLGRPTGQKASSLRCAVLASEEAGLLTSKEVAARSTSQESQRNGVNNAGARRNRGAGHEQSGLQTLFGASYAIAATAAHMFSNPPQHLPIISALRSDVGETTSGAPRPSISTLTSVVSRRRVATMQQPRRMGARTKIAQAREAAMELIPAKDQDVSAPICFQQRSQLASIDSETVPFSKQIGLKPRPSRPGRTARRQSSKKAVHAASEEENSLLCLEFPQGSPLAGLEKRMSRNATPPRQALLQASRKQLFITQQVEKETGGADSASSQQPRIDCSMNDAGSRSADPALVQEPFATCGTGPDVGGPNAAAMSAGDAQVSEVQEALSAAYKEHCNNLLPQSADEVRNDARMPASTLNGEAASFDNCERSESDPMSPMHDPAPSPCKPTEGDHLEPDKEPLQESYFDYYNAYQQYPSIPQFDPSALTRLLPRARVKAPGAKDALSDVTMSIATEKHMECDAEVIIPTFIYLPALRSEADEVVETLGNIGVQHEETCTLDASIPGQQKDPSHFCKPSNAASRGVELVKGSRKRREKEVVNKAGKTAAKLRVSANRVEPHGNLAKKQMYTNALSRLLARRSKQQRQVPQIRGLKLKSLCVDPAEHVLRQTAWESLRSMTAALWTMLIAIRLIVAAHRRQRAEKSRWSVWSPPLLQTRTFYRLHRTQCKQKRWRMRKKLAGHTNSALGQGRSKWPMLNRMSCKRRSNMPSLYGVPLV